MNEQTSKKIIFNKSTLLSLKAELLKKQDEVYEKKQKPQHKVENFKPAKVTDIEKTTKGLKRTLKDNLKAVDTEELEACRKSKLALEKKTELYEHLVDGVGSSQLAGRFLVDFNTKKQVEAVKHIPDVPIESDIGQDTEYKDGDNEWSEFTDCLGRTRKCHVSDLEMYKKRDRDLMRIMYKDTTGNEDEALENTESQKIVEKPLLVQTTNDYLQSLREKWEEKEKELLAKDKDIHYQDILFDEARIHGVGYYAFSTDDTERQKQMEELMKRRQETLRAQQEAERARNKRDQLMAARVAAARARQRARAGLPPEEPQENQDDFNKRLLEFLTQQKNEADAKATEEEKRAKEEMEKERQKLREAYVREWDLGKEGVEDKVKKFREMTQEEYVEQQRDKRINEFAPPQTSTNEQSNYSFDNTGRMVNREGSVPIKTWADVRPKVKTPPPPDIGDLSDLTEQKGLYFSTATTSETTVKYRNFVKAQDPIPIDNELSDEEPVDDYRVIDKRKHDSNHSEIAPPPTYDYYGPVPKQAKCQKPFESNIREAYAQGAKSLEPKSSNRKLPQHYDFTFD